MDEFEDISRLLRDERPRASELELDDIKRRVRQRVARKGQPMRSRLAILAMLVAGLLFAGTGAGLAVQGFDQSGSDASQGSRNVIPNPSATLVVTAASAAARFSTNSMPPLVVSPVSNTIGASSSCASRFQWS